MTASVSPEAKQKVEYHLNCHDCGKFVQKELRIRKDDPHKKHSICRECLSDYDSGYESW